MPVLDGMFEAFNKRDSVLHNFLTSGVGAATAIRRAERERRLARSHLPSTPELMYSSRLIALTGMSSREDKRKAFEAGVDG